MGRRPGRKSGTKEKTIKYFDYTLLFVIIFLVCFGLVMLYSTSSYNAQIEYGDGTHYLKRQAFACCLGFAAMFVISKIDYHVWKRLYGVAYIGAFLLCVSVIFLGSNGNGSTRWFRLGPLSFQPSEFAKLAVIIFLATVISRMQKKIGDLKELMKVMVLLLPLVGPVAYTNLSTAIIIMGIAVILIFLLLIWRLMIIANNASDLFGALLVVGVLGHIAIQVILNVAVVTNSMPNTGVSLPFISYGGSSILFLLIEMGLVMSVARGIKVRDV